MIKNTHGIELSLLHIFRKHQRYISRTYNTQMDYAIFFINDGKAIQQLNAVSITSFLKVVGIESLGTHGYENVWDYEKVI